MVSGDPARSYEKQLDAFINSTFTDHHKRYVAKKKNEVNTDEAKAYEVMSVMASTFDKCMEVLSKEDQQRVLENTHWSIDRGDVSKVVKLVDGRVYEDKRMMMPKRTTKRVPIFFRPTMNKRRVL